MSLFDTAPAAIQQNMIRDVQEMARHETGRSIDEEQAAQLARTILARAKSREALYRVSTARLRSLVDKVTGSSRHHAAKAKKVSVSGRYPFGGTEYGALHGPGARVVYRVINPSTGITDEFDEKREALEHASERSLKERGEVAVEQGTMTSAGVFRHDLTPQIIWRSEWRTETKPSRRHATKKSAAQLDREIAEALAGGGSTSSFEQAKAEAARLESEVDAASEAIRAFPRGSMGLVPDAVRATPQYRAANDRYQKAFARLRNFNATFTKRFAKELRAERAKRYGGR